MSSRQGIVIVEDNYDDLFFLRRAFSRAGIAEPITCLRSGRELIEHLTGCAPDKSKSLAPQPKLILLDLALPELSGLAVLEWMCKESAAQNIPVIVFTGMEDPKFANRALELGAARCYRKDPDPSNWVNTVREMAQLFEICRVAPMPTGQDETFRRAA